ncbi:DUF1552 domain-containing protein [Lignipirellula cremea]|uniref:DUF1552 domain-containing protein n=1 Tax=Lignipirellula cremea TaxID=2528010 RepID=A0A518DKS1_9BACT|nr:DUF1552 domain-containing protein [Lignipirellula cremea]QDU92438.1 hypothetical protein Pla8534_01860 [Lignipirellula cremea]
MDRRNALKNLSLGAGALVLSPILSRLQAQAAGLPTPKRFVFVVESNGVRPEQICPVGVKRKPRDQRPGGPTELIDLPLADHELQFSLEPLAPWKDKLTIVEGLSGRICGGGHSNNFQALGAFGAGRGNGGESTVVGGETIDGALAKTMPGIFPHLGLGMSKRVENNVIYNISALEANRPLPTICKPDQAYAALFGSVAQGAAQEEFAAKNNLLDFLRNDIKKVQANLVGQEKEQFGAYLESFETLRNRQSRLNEIEHTLREQAPAPSDKYTSEVETDRLDAQFDIGAAALISGLTNVLTLSSAAGIRDFDVTFKGLGILLGKHGIGHGGSYQGKTWSELYDIIRRYHMDLIAGLARKLEAVPEGNGSMLDNTVIVYLSDGAEGHHSRCWEWPMVVLGNLGGKLKAGRYVDYPGYGQPGHRTTANMYVTLLQLAGSQRTSFGMPDPNLKDFDQHGPLEELLA